MEAMDDSRLTDQKYTELEYLFQVQTIEMAKTQQEFMNYRDDTAAALSVSATKTPPGTHMQELQPDEEELTNSDALKPYAWNLVKRLRRQRRFTVSHGTPPPAPPSTPTSSSMQLASSSSLSGSSNTANDYDSDCFNFNLLYILDYAPKYKKKLKEQQRTDAELAELFNVVTITGSGDKAIGKAICAASRNIRKPEASTKIFKIHRNPKEFLREPDEEDSVSAPEYDTEEEETRYRRFTRRVTRWGWLRKERRLAKFELKERMEQVVDNFDAAMSFGDA